MSFRDVDSIDTAVAYVEKLNQKWPARKDIMAEIANQINAFETDNTRVLELCCGAGTLGLHLLENVSFHTYLGIDQSEPLLSAAEELLSNFMPSRATLLRDDLNGDKWYPKITEIVGPLNAIVSMQSIHDLGGEAEVTRIYQLAYDLLMPGGLFINADLIVEPGSELPNNPGRLPINRHLELLVQIGYKKPACALELGGFGCIVAKK